MTGALADETAAEARGRAIRRVLLVTMAINLATAGAKGVAGLAFGILSLAADGLHSAFDALNNVVGLIAIWRSTRPPDVDHPYGHRKFETFGTLAVSLCLVLAGVGIVRAAIERLGGAEAPRI
ncbi:MAG TPA: cation diffusion facilitator family transporter, partial [Planctomycetota bacterium]|nr:cation diffusion facilitator family transporter [Planctomycetota bacterium]